MARVIFFVDWMLVILRRSSRSLPPGIDQASSREECSSGNVVSASTTAISASAWASASGSDPPWSCEEVNSSANSAI